MSPLELGIRRGTMRVFAAAGQDTGWLTQHASVAKFPAPCLPGTFVESLQAIAGRTLKDYKNRGRALRHCPRVLLILWTVQLWIAAIGLALSPIISTEPSLPSDNAIALTVAAVAAIMAALGTKALLRQRAEVA